MKNIDWKALLLAPVAFPALCSLLIVLPDTGGNRAFGFAFFFVLGSLVSYGATFGLLLPALLLLPVNARRLTTARAACLGALLGALLHLPLGWIFWRSSGPDSGPPEDAFLTYLLHSMSDPLLLALPFGGLVTTLLYRGLAARRKKSAAMAHG